MTIGYGGSVAVSSLLTLLTLPLVTLRLGPAQFGQFALVLVFISLGGTLATLGSGFVIFRQVAEAPKTERMEVLGALVGLAFLVTAGIAALGGGVLLVLGTLGSGLPISATAQTFAIAALVLSPYWIIATDFLVLRGRAGLYGFVTIVATVAAVSTTLFSLFVLDAGVVSLFAGQLASSLVLAVGAAIALSENLKSLPSRSVMWRLAQHSPAFGLSQGLETGYSVVETSLLAQFTSFRTVGLYSHSQRYRYLAAGAVTAVARAVWPVTLEEARNRDSNFEVTRQAWRLIHQAVVVAGLAAALVGDVVISALTNDKFTSAYPYVSVWMILVLAQNSAKPQVGAAYALGDVRSVATPTIVASGAAIALLAVAVPWGGAPAAITAALVQVVVYRVGVFRMARRLRTTPFADQWVLIGAGLIAATLLLRAAVDVSVALRVVILVGCLLAFGCSAARTLRNGRRHSSHIRWIPWGRERLGDD